MSSSYYISPEWYAFKDFVKALSGTTCEYCELRPVKDLHHVVYFSFECEAPAHVILLCAECHAVQHGFFRGQKLKYKRGSPLDERLSGGELLEFLVEKRGREWTAYRHRLERLYEVTGDCADLIAQGEMYFARCDSGLPSF
jgi:hypothetical protein